MIKNYLLALLAACLLAGQARAAQAGQEAMAQFDGGAETELALRQLRVPGQQAGHASADVKLAPRFGAAPAYGAKFLNVIELDPARVTVKSASAKKVFGRNLATVPEFAAARPDALAVINASFFNTVSTSIPETPLFEGYFVEDGELLPYSGKQKRVFYVTRDGAPGVAMQTDLPPLETIYSAIAGYGAGSKVDATARTAACLLPGGRLRLIGAYPVRTLDLMTEFLRNDQGCSAYVHFDGGGSAQMFYRNGDERLSVGWNRYPECYEGDTAMPAKCYRRVASVLLVLPKP